MNRRSLRAPASTLDLDRPPVGVLPLPGRRRRSTTADPPAPLTRHTPFQDVSNPGLHQLPLKVKRSPPSNSNIASAAASPRVPAPGGVVGLAVDGDRLGAEQVAGQVELVDGHVDQQRVVHLVAETAEVRGL